MNGQTGARTKVFLFNVSAGPLTERTQGQFGGNGTCMNSTGTQLMRVQKAKISSPALQVSLHASRPFGYPSDAVTLDLLERPAKTQLTPSTRWGWQAYANILYCAGYCIDTEINAMHAPREATSQQPQLNATRIGSKPNPVMIQALWASMGAGGDVRGAHHNGNAGLLRA